MNNSYEYTRLEGQKAERALKDTTEISSIMFVLEAQKEDGAFDETTILEHADLFPVWDENWTGKRGGIVQYEGLLYKSIHDVGAGQNTKPSETPSMWTKLGDPSEEYPQWSQPIGVHDAWQIGDKVTHNGKKWVCVAANCVWEPGVYGWDIINEIFVENFILDS